MEIIAKFFVRFFPKAAAEIRCLAVDEYEKKVAARESRRPRLSRANLLESLGFEEVPGDCDVQPPEGVCRYAFGHTWYLKGDTLVGLQPNESVVVKGVRKYPLDTQVGEEVTPNWEEDSSFYLPEDWVRGSMYWRGRDTPQFVVCTPPPDGRVRVTIEMQWGEDTPTASKFAVFKV